ncbi:mitochondrial glycerol-3-phosphate dehydrogenase, partial [Perkinsus olseni]
EMAESVVDVIAYRARMAFVDPVGTKAILPEIVNIVGDRKGWDKKKRAAEMEKAKQFLRTMTYGEGQTTAMAVKTEDKSREPNEGQPLRSFVPVRDTLACRVGVSDESASAALDLVEFIKGVNSALSS